MLRPRTRWLLVICGTLIVGSLLVAKYAIFPGRAFDRVAWRADAETGSGARQAMADRMLSRGTLIGLTRDEVVELLGTPPPTSYFTDWDLVYWLGPERRWMSIDSECLVVRLASNGQVSEAQLVND